jgi:hypothetical protein
VGAPVGGDETQQLHAGTPSPIDLAPMGHPTRRHSLAPDSATTVCESGLTVPDRRI